MSRIGLFDSGIGGTTILKELINIMPNEDYVYYADNKNNPYGELDDSELFPITENIVRKLIECDCKIIVIACNTATTRCIKHLREVFPDITFVGTEPAIKVACDNDYKNILVLATPGTCASERTKWLIDTYQKEGQTNYLVPCFDLANAIERNKVHTEERIIKEIYQIYKDKGIDCIVLGCTHYPLIKELIGDYFKDIPLIDGSVGVAKRVKYLLEEKNNLSYDGTGNVLMIYSDQE